MTRGLTPFNAHPHGTSFERRRFVEIVCPGCSMTFELLPGHFAARRRANKGRAICCSVACSRAYKQSERKALREKLMGGA